MNLSADEIIKRLIALGDEDSLSLIDIEVEYDLLRKVAKTSPLTAENIYQTHGIEASILYMEICNAHDRFIHDEDVLRYIAKKNASEEA